MNDMASVIVPKSDQTNADDLIAGPITIKITSVTIKPGIEQPIAINYENDNGKPYKPCKSMCRCMVTAWGPDSKRYVGRYMTLYRDPKVKWAGMEVGGIRISHMSNIEEPLTMALTVTKQNRRPYTVQPLKAKEHEAAQVPAQGQRPEPNGIPHSQPASAECISVDQAIEIADLFAARRWNKEKFLAKHGIKSFEQLTQEQYRQIKEDAKNA